MEGSTLVSRLTVEADIAFHLAQGVLRDAAIRTRVLFLQVSHDYRHFHVEDGFADHLHVVFGTGNHHFALNINTLVKVQFGELSFVHQRG